jgi:1-acyl-sn-glycerol-3-phosphate acyltransferase
VLASLLDKVAAGLGLGPDPDLDARLRVVAGTLALNGFGYDKFGLSASAVRSTAGIWKWLYRNYFRCEAHGIERVPPGRGLLVGNHSSQLAYDGALVAMAMLLEADPPRAVRAMIEKFFQHQPFVNVMMTRTGQLTGLPENCERLLADDQLIMVFPEGARGGGKTYWERYELKAFGQGFVRMALRARAPITPFAFVGGEEVCPSLVNLRPLARLLGAPYAPLTPTIVPLPLPAKCSVWFGEPLWLEGTGDEEDAFIADKTAAVRERIAALLAQGLAARKGVFV